jgi:hypothetical protein
MGWRPAHRLWTPLAATAREVGRARAGEAPKWRSARQKPAGEERDALRRDRYRAVLLAQDGKEAAEIADALGQARRSVQDWAYACRDGGVDAVQPAPRPGRAPKLPRDREAELKARLDAGRRPRTAASARCAARS